MNEDTKSFANVADQNTSSDGNVVIARSKLDELNQEIVELMAWAKKIIEQKQKLEAVVTPLYNIPKNGMYRLETDKRVIVLRCEDSYDIKPVA